VTRATALGLAVILGLTSCGAGEGLTGEGVSLESSASRPPRPVPTHTADAPAAPERRPAPAPSRPAWLGKRILPIGEHGFGQIRPTPPALRNRRLPSLDTLSPPSKKTPSATITAVPQAVAARSTWSSACPVSLEDLRYITVPFVGFDGRRHTGELIVHESVAKAVANVFLDLYRADFPIEEMRIVRADELDAPPTGDGNNTTAFVCRPTRGATSWSQHAYGLAVDVNPFRNPYVSGDVVLPELASAYRDRDWQRPGMVTPNSPPVPAFGDIGWVWGGTWTSLKDWMHFSANGR
jgi:hypothetical protein